jgi:imidazolonepropionase-like amidohydrolase
LRPKLTETGEIIIMKKLIVVAALLASTSAQAETFAIQAGRLIVDASQPARGPSTVIVENGRIARIESGATAPAGATIVDMTSQTVMPGLIDAHVHLTGDPGTPFWREAIDSNESAAVTGVKNALLTARAGFTTVRDLGAPGLSSLRCGTASQRGKFRDRVFLRQGQPSRSSAGTAMCRAIAPK